MDNLFGWGETEERDELTETVDDEATMRLRAEELDVSKHAVETGAVTLHKDIVEETQTVNVPVSHEEVIVERRAVSAAPSDEPIGEEETIRIPVSEERVAVDKRTVVTGEVGLRKRTVQETAQVTETVRKEVADVDVDGQPRIVESAAAAEDDLR